MDKVGFIGLDRISKPMAINVLEAGFELTVCDLRTEPVTELVSRGAHVAQSRGHWRVWILSKWRWWMMPR